MSNTKYDLIIIGAGPAALTASVYASRYKVSNIVVGKILGGLASSAHKVCNWPSEPAITGMDLMAKMHQTVNNLGAPVTADEVVEIKKQADGFMVKTLAGKEFEAKSLLIATGTENRKLNLPEEDGYLGRGVSYCATCDGMFYRSKVVAVVGGSDSANTTSLYMADIAQKVYQIYRGDELRGDVTWIEQIKNNDKIEVIYSNEIKALSGEGKIASIVLKNDYQGSGELLVDGVFIEIGSEPKTALFQAFGVKTTATGLIEVGADQATNVAGVWAAGDVTTNSNNFHQIITAAAEGAIASESIFKYLKKHQK